LTNEPATNLQENFHTLSGSPIEERARLPVTAKTSFLITEHGFCHIANAGSAISQCISDAKNDIPVASVAARDADNSNTSNSEDDMPFVARRVKNSGSSDSTAFASSKDRLALVVESETDLVAARTENAVSTRDAERTQYELRQTRRHKFLTNELEAQVEIMVELATPTLNAFDRPVFDHGAEVIKAIVKIFAERHAKRQKPPKEKVINGEYPSTKAEIYERLKGAEEDLHSWASSKKLPKDFLLRRVTDGSSKARRYHNQGIFAQTSNSNFKTRRSRYESMDKHLNYSNREATAIISLTGCPKDFVEERIRRQDRRLKLEKGDNRELTYINTLSLEADGVPVLLAEDEVRYYDVRRAIGEHWIKDEYFVLLKIDVKHIVGTWYWTDVQTYMREHKCTFYDWEEAMVFPAFRKHELARKEGRQCVPEGGCACCPHGFKAMDVPKPRVGADAEKEQ
jgi:hypothetical protein